MKKEEYIKQVLKKLPVRRKLKRRIKEDLEQRIDDAMEQDPYYDIVREMGSPAEYAAEFKENLDESEFWLIVPQAKEPYEYKSKMTLFGLPLVHIHLSGGYGSVVARGIIAIGDIAIGVISFGGVSVGVLSLGGVGIGVAAIGGVAIGGFVAGGVALGLYALGAVAIGIVQAFGAIPNLLT